MQQVNRKRLNLKLRQDDPQRSVAYGIGTLVVEHPGYASTFRRSPHGCLSRGDGEARADRHVSGARAVLQAEWPARGRRQELEIHARQDGQVLWRLGCALPREQLR